MSRLRFFGEAMEITSDNRFDSFFEQHFRLMYATALTRTAHSAAAEDMVQETMLRAWRNQEQVLCLPLPAQRAWLLTTLRNVSVDWVRLEKPSRWQSLEETPEATDTGGETDDAVLRLDVRNALRQLSERDREIVLLRYFEELNSREIAETLSMPEGSVRRRLVLCREKLSDLLTDREDEQG